MRSSLPTDLDGHAQRYRMVLITIWKRDEHGWRGEFTAKAKEMSGIEIQRESPWSLPGSWEVCTCRWNDSIKAVRHDPACKFFHYAFEERS